MSGARVAALLCCAALSLGSSARVYGDDEEDEQPIVKSTSVEDGLIMLGRGRSERGWEILADEENRALAKRAALVAIKGEEPYALRGAAIYLGSSKVWGKGKGHDHPGWRVPLAERLEKTRTRIGEIEAALGAKGLKAKRRRALQRKLRETLAREELLLEAVGLLGVKATWKELAGQLQSGARSSVVRGAARGLTGPRAKGLSHLSNALGTFEAGRAKGLKLNPSLSARIEIVRSELERVARSGQAMQLVASVEQNLSASGLEALQRLVSPRARKQAWRAVERAARSRDPGLRVAAIALVPKLKGPNSKFEFLLELLENDADVRVRAAAASATGRLSRGDAVEYLPILIEALKDEVPVREAVGRSLVQLTGHEMGPVHRSWERWLARQ